MEEQSKITVKQWFACIKCEKKMESISLGSSSDLFGLGSGSSKGMYCDNKECDRYGLLTVAGIKKEE